MSLTEYKRKRNFRRTPEPAGRGAAAPGRSFVVQKHDASRLHYDFRLELDGALKSWAVPKGPTLDSTVRSLAVQVEDHPLDYASFEGVIPQGEYGGGTVMVWDHGTWEPEGDPAKAYRSGKLSFELHGEKLKGAWSLVRMGGRAGDGGKNWLLIKRDDKAARKGSRVLETKTKSVVSGRSMDEIAAEADRVWSSNRNGKATKGKTKSPSLSKHATSTAPLRIAEVAGARKSPLPRNFSPQLATLAASIPEGNDWLHELKFDGYRILAFVDGGKVRLVTRNGNDWTKRFSTVAVAVKGLPVKSAIFDGEIVSIDDAGHSNFQQLQNLLKRGDDEALVYYAFDLPYLNGYDLTNTPLGERKQALVKLVMPQSPNGAAVVRYSDHIEGQGDEVFAHACQAGMEGVVSKRADSKYQQFRSPAWLKVKCLQRQEFIIAGFSPPNGSRVGFGALLLGYYKDGKLVYAGRVGTGFTHDSLRQLTAELKKRRIATNPFRTLPKGADTRGVTWVRPELVGEVEFTEWTSDGLLRHPSFQGIREDKSAKEIVREREAPAGKLAKAAAKMAASTKSTSTNGRAMRARKKPAAKKVEEATVAGVRITHPNRVLYAEQGITKLELARFYERIADRILPHIVGRPLALVRCPTGQSGECFYQKHLSDSTPGDFQSVAIQEKSKRTAYPVIDGISGLISLVQIGVLEIHPWPAVAKNVEKPDRLVMDLDPGPGIAWSAVVEGARELRERFREHKLESFVRTSGGKGLHVVAPLKPGAGWVELKEFARSIAEELVAAEPKRYVATMTKAKRMGKVFVDFFRNSRGSTAVASYSTRARAGAPIAMPLRWKELGKVKSADQFNVANVARRLGAQKADPWEGFFEVRQTL